MGDLLQKVNVYIGAGEYKVTPGWTLGSTRLCPRGSEPYGLRQELQRPSVGPAFSSFFLIQLVHMLRCHRDYGSRSFTQSVLQSRYLARHYLSKVQVSRPLSTPTTVGTSLGVTFSRITFTVLRDIFSLGREKQIL